MAKRNPHLQQQNIRSQLKKVNNKVNHAKMEKITVLKKIEKIIEEKTKLYPEDLIPGKEYFIGDSCHKAKFVKIDTVSEITVFVPLENMQHYIKETDGTVVFAIHPQKRFQIHFTQSRNE